MNQSGSFQLAYNVTDDYGVTEGKVTFRAAKPQADGARPLVEAPKLPLRIDREPGARTAPPAPTGGSKRIPMPGSKSRPTRS